MAIAGTLSIMQPSTLLRRQLRFETRLFTIPANEERALLHQRIAFAQKEFGEIGKDGMDTDRGRVYIKYGPPQEISEMTGDLTCKDNEIWHYHMEVERIFVFLDEYNTGVYRLIHSNYPGEVDRPNWELLVCEHPHIMTFN